MSRDEDGLQVREPDDATAQQPRESLQVGPSRPSLFDRIPARWRRHAVSVTIFVFGVGTALWWQERPSPPSFPADEHAVELLLFRTVPPATYAGRESGIGPLRIDGAVFLSGSVASTVLRVEGPEPNLDVRTPALPVTVSSTARIQSVGLVITVANCEAADRWTPVDRPFSITWRDEFGKVHTDRAGDFDRSIAASLIRYIDAACDSALDRVP